MEIKCEIKRSLDFMNTIDLKNKMLLFFFLYTLPLKLIKLFNNKAFSKKA